MKFEAWHYNYMYYLYPNMDISVENMNEREVVLNKLHNVNAFDSEKAKAFKAGFETSIEIIREEILEVFSQYELIDFVDEEM